MQTSTFHYAYPGSLVATEPRADFRTLVCSKASASHYQEITREDIFSLFQEGDVLAINDTRVLRRRVTAPNGFEILFLNSKNGEDWDVLCPARSVRDGEDIPLPNGVRAQIVERGLPQRLRVSEPLTEDYFARFAELALPPYIQKARLQRHNGPDEEKWYQTAWASQAGSYAAPTASLHFSWGDLSRWENIGVTIAPFTLHVGLGTFLPVKAKNLNDHVMHAEPVFIPQSSIQKIQKAKREGGKVWALGTTAVRALESWGAGRLHETPEGDYAGSTDLFIRPGFHFTVVDRLMTNFHQPESTLLALVAAFSGLENTLAAYEWAISRKFRLFSYGDLSIWI